MIRKLETLQEDIVSTQKMYNVIIIFTKRSIYVSGKKQDVDKFVEKSLQEQEVT